MEFNFDDLPYEAIMNALAMHDEELAKMKEPFEKKQKALTEEEKRKEIIDINYTKAYEVIPESFFSVEMIYVPCAVGSEYITAFVDTGAQINIMNINTAINSGLGDLIDQDAQTELVGVGTDTSLGQIHYAELTIGRSIVSCSFTVVASGPDIIIGLNTLIRHKCILDMGKKIMIIGDDEVHFLSDKNIIGGFNDNFKPKSENKKHKKK